MPTRPTPTNHHHARSAFTAATAGLAFVALLALAACGDPAGGGRQSATTHAPSASAPLGSADETDVPTTDVLTTDAEAVAPADRTAILAESARTRVDVDNSFGGGDAGFREIRILSTIGASGPDGAVDLDAGRPATDAERGAIETALGSHYVVWVTGDAGTDPENPDHVAVLTLGDAREIDGRLVVASQLWCGGTCAILNTHEVVRSATGWELGDVIGATAMA